MNDIYECVSREVISEYRELLLKWNKVINLVSFKDLDDLLHRHVIDSLQILQFIDDKDVSIVDLGSGAGFPGVMLSLAGVNNVTLIESDSRKAAFLLEASKLSSCKMRIINERVEDVVDLKCDILTSRAFADLTTIFKLSKNIIVRDKYLLHKGASYDKEIVVARKHWLFEERVHDSITSTGGKILEIRNVQWLQKLSLL